MTKTEFLEALRQKLAGIPADDANRSIAYYSEMLDDYMEDGMREEDAVASMGDLDEIASQILADMPLGRLVKQKMRPKRRMQAWEIVLIVLGCPIWLSLLAALLVVILALGVVLLSLIATLWAVGVACVGCVIGSMASGVVFFCHGLGAQGVFMIGTGICLVGLSILMYFVSLYTAVGVGKLMQKGFTACKAKLAKGDEEIA